MLRLAACRPGGLNLSRGSLLAAILAQTLRSMVEAVRLTTLGRAGFQQIQLDIHYLRPRLQQFVSRGANDPPVNPLQQFVVRGCRGPCGSLGPGAARVPAQGVGGLMLPASGTPAFSGLSSGLLGNGGACADARGVGGQLVGCK